MCSTFLTGLWLCQACRSRILRSACAARSDHRTRRRSAFCHPAHSPRNVRPPAQRPAATCPPAQAQARCRSKIRSPRHRAQGLEAGAALCAVYLGEHLFLTSVYCPAYVHAHRSAVFKADKRSGCLFIVKNRRFSRRRPPNPLRCEFRSCQCACALRPLLGRLRTAHEIPCKVNDVDADVKDGAAAGL